MTHTGRLSISNDVYKMCKTLLEGTFMSSSRFIVCAGFTTFVRAHFRGNIDCNSLIPQKYLFH